MRRCSCSAYFRKYSGRLSPPARASRRRRDPDLDGRGGDQDRDRDRHGDERGGEQIVPAPRRGGDGPRGEREEQRGQLRQRVREQADEQQGGRQVQLAGEVGGAVAERVGLGAERERRRQDHEADRQRAGLVVDLAHDAAVALGDGGERRPGHEAGDAGERVQRQHERRCGRGRSRSRRRSPRTTRRGTARRWVGRREHRDQPGDEQQHDGDGERAERPRSPGCGSGCCASARARGACPPNPGRTRALLPSH